MTKHLRYLFATLLVWVCTVGGYAQTTVTIWSEDWSSVSKEATVSNVNSAYSSTGTGTKVYTTGTASAGGKLPELLIYQKKSGVNGSWTVKLDDLKQCSGEFTLTYKSNRNLVVTANGATVTMNSSASNSKLYTGTFSLSSDVNSLTLVFTNTLSSNARIDDVVLTGTSSSSSTATKTTTTFNISDGLDVDNQTFNLVNGKYNGEAFVGYAAKCTTDGAAGTIEYKSSEESVATVGTDGTLTIVGIGTTDITATFVPDDATAYATSSAKYTVVNSEPAKTATSLSFGADKDGSTVALTEGLLSDGSEFTGYTATESTGAAGTIAYAATGDNVATVDATSGAVTVNKTTYGTTTITATFTPTDADAYATSTATYTITNEKKVDESTIVFSSDDKSFAKISDLSGSGYKSGNVDFVASNGKSYTFACKSVMLNNDRVQIKSATITSPKFDNFTSGYNLTVTYSSNSGNLKLSSGNINVTGASTGSATTYKSVTLNVADGSSFVIEETKGNALYIKSIEIVKITPKADPALSFANPTQEVELKEDAISVQTITKPSDFNGTVTYVSSDNTIAEVDDYMIILKKTGEVTIKATSAATDNYAAGSAEYTLKVVDNRADAQIGVKEENVNIELSTGIYDIAENLNNANGLELTYASSNEDVKVDEETGYITFTKVGSATITVSFAGNKTYKPFEGTFTLNITDSRVADENFKFGKTSYEVEINEVNGTFYAANDLSNPNGLNVTWTIEPASLATIDKDGKVSVNERGTYTITATGAANDSYSETTATCQLVVNDNTVEDKSVEFVAGTNKGTQTGYGNADEMRVNPVTIYSLNAAFAAFTTDDKTNVTTYTYRMYKDGMTSISTKIGTIKKIEFVSSGNDSKFSLVGLTADAGDYSCTDANYGVWTGSVKEVTFTASAQARATNIIVTLEVPKMKQYSFSETASDITLEDYDNANVTIDRKLDADGGWWTLCLPFALDATQVATYFGDGTELRTFDSMNGTTMNFKSVTEMEAGMPYLIKPAKTFDGTTTPFKTVQLKASDPQKPGDQGYFMLGTYKTATLTTDGTELFLGASNKFYKPKEGSNTLKGFRVYFAVPQGTNSSAIMANIDGVETAITRLDGETFAGAADTRVYNLQGQCVGTTLRGLASGIYVCGGRKVVVK